MTDLYLPIAEAEMKYHLDLYSLLELGKIRSAMLTTMPGVILVSDQDIRSNLPRDEQPDYKQFAHLKGIQIGIREASRKYNIASAIISRWVKRGLIREYGDKPVRGGYSKMIDEADIAYCVLIRNNHPGRGKWLFKPDGTSRK